MRRPHLALGLLLAAALTVAPTVALGATTVRVDDDGKASATDCNATKTAPKLIGKGVLKAGAGGTVIVCPGTYREAIALTGTQDAITIKGATKRTAKLLRPAVFPASASLITINSEIDGALISGLAFGVPASGECTSRGILSAGRSVRIVGNSFTGRKDCLAIAISIQPETTDGTVSATVKGNLVKNAFITGVVASGSATTVSITGNTIRNTLGAEAPLSTVLGIQLHSGVAGVVSGNTITDANAFADRNTKPTVYPAISVAYVDRPSLTTLVKGNTITAGDGIWLEYSSNVGIRDNTITSPKVDGQPTGHVGIQAHSAVNNAITGNTVRGAITGINIYMDGTYSTGNVISGNTLTGNTAPCSDNNSLGGSNTWTDNTIDAGKTCP